MFQADWCPENSWGAALQSPAPSLWCMPVGEQMAAALQGQTWEHHAMSWKELRNEEIPKKSTTPSAAAAWAERMHGSLLAWAPPAQTPEQLWSLGWGEGALECRQVGGRSQGNAGMWVIEWGRVLDPENQPPCCGAFVRLPRDNSSPAGGQQCPEAAISHPGPSP